LIAKTTFLSLFFPILLLGCQTRPQNNAYVTFYSDPPFAKVNNDVLPVRQFWSPDKLPNGFPSNCANILTPTVRWPDGAIQYPTTIRLCSFEASYTIKKPSASNSPSTSSTYQAQTYTNGDSYYGQLKDGKRSGYGTYKHKDGGVYEGYFSDGTYNGTGTYTFKNGDYFVGNYLNGKRQGNGKFFDSKGKLLSEGTYANDVLVRTNKAENDVKSYSPNTQTQNKCDRLGLTKGTEDYSLCLKSLKTKQ
jgi:hypothetical protein